MFSMKNRYLDLVKAINQANHHYYTLDQPLMADGEYDLLYDELVQLENDNPDWKVSHSPSDRVGGDVLPGFESKAHIVPLYSLRKANDFETVQKFTEEVDVEATIATEYAIEEKMDGLTVMLTYDNGYFVEGRTRGLGGLVGEVVTAQVKTIRSIPLQVEYKQRFEVHGEIFMPLSGLKRYNENLPEGASPLKNARNGAAGAVRNLNPKVTASRPLEAFFYAIPYIEGNADLATQVDIFKFLRHNGFKTNPSFKIVKDFAEIVEMLNDIAAYRNQLDWDIDGVVIKVNDLSLREELGYTSKYPKGAIAYKFETVEVTTPLLYVRGEVGRTGKITPRGFFTPVDILGSTVEKATLNNYNDIVRKGLLIGADIFVRKSNDVIPEIMGIVPGSTGTPIEKPTNCPDCGSALEEDGANLYCLNGVACSAQSAAKFEHFASREMMNIDSLAGKTIDQLMNAGLLQNSFADFYRITKADLLALERFDVKKADRLLAAIEASKTRPLQAFLMALGIRHASEGTSERLLNHFNSIEEIMAASYEQILSIRDIGPTTANSVYEFFRIEENVQMIRELRELGISMAHDAPAIVGDQLSGSTFVLTGKVSRPRKQIEALIKEHGGKTSGTISNTTTYLVAGEAAGSKLTKAQSLGVQVITEDELYEMVQ